MQVFHGSVWCTSKFLYYQKYFFHILALKLYLKRLQVFLKSYLSEYVFMSDLQNLGKITAMKHRMVVNIKASFGVPWIRKYYNMVNHLFLRSPLVHLPNQ